MRCETGRDAMSMLNQENRSRSQSVVPQLQGIDYVELYVSNARQAAHYYRTAFGFVPIAYSGLETGVRDHTSIVLRQGECVLVLTAPLIADSPVSHYIQLH